MRGLGPADEFAQDGVHLFHGIIVLDGELGDERSRDHHEAVADEVGRVLGPHRALAQVLLHELGHELEDGGVSAWAGDDLHQFEVAGRVEEVGAQEVLEEVLGAALADEAQRDARGVGADDGVGLAHLLDAGHELLLGLQFLDNGLDDPVGLAHPVEVVLHVAGGDEGQTVFAEQGRGLALLHALDALHDDAVAHLRVIEGQSLRLFFGGQGRGHDVQQVHGNAGVGQVGGDGRAHGASADDGSLANDAMGHVGYPPWLVLGIGYWVSEIGDWRFVLISMRATRALAMVRVLQS